MVNRGDTVTVTIPTFLTGIGTYGGARTALQQRLQQVGFQVLRIDDSALSYLGALSARGQLLVTVIPTTSAYGSVQDVASLVAGAAYAVGYDIRAGAGGVVAAQAGAGSQSYQDLQNTPPPLEDNDMLKLLTGIGTPLLIGGVVLLAIVLIKK